MLFSIATNGQTFVFNSNGVLEKLISTHAQQNPEEWALRNGGRELLFDEKWCPVAGDYLVYRHLSLMYILPSENIGEDIKKLNSRVFSDPGLSKALQKFEVSIYSVHFNQEDCVTVVDFVFGELASMEETKNGMETKIEEIQGLLNGKGQNDIDQGFAGMSEAQAEYVKSFLLTDSKSRKVFDELREEYTPKIQEGDYPQEYSSTPEEVISAFVVEDYKWELLSEISEAANLPMQHESKGDSPGHLSSNSDSPEPGDGEKATEGTQSSNSSDSGSDAANGNHNNGNSKSSGLKGPFKIKNPFSKWFAVLIKIVAKYLGIEEIGTKILAIAYMIAPELFDYCGSFLAKCQKAITAKSLDEFLNHVADVYLHMEKFLNYATKIYDLVHDQRLADLIDKIDWKKVDLDKALEDANKFGLLSDKHLNKVRQFVPLEALNGIVMSSPGLLKEKLLKYGAEQATNQLDRGMSALGVPIQFSSITSCISHQDTSGREKCVKGWMKQQAANVIAGKTPGLEGHQEAIKHLLDGDSKRAVELATIIEVAKRTGLSEGNLRSMYDSLKVGNHEAFILHAIETGMTTVNECNHLTNDVLQKLRGKKVVDERLLISISSCILEITGQEVAAYRSKTAGQALLEWSEEISQAGNLKKWAKKARNGYAKKVEEKVEKISELSQYQAAQLFQGEHSQVIHKILVENLRALGITSPDAIKAMLAEGNIEKGIELQIRSELPSKGNTHQLILRKAYIKSQVHTLHQNLSDPAWIERHLFQKSLNRS